MYKPVSIILRKPDPKGGSVKFEIPREEINQDEQIVTNVYVNRGAAVKHAGVEEPKALNKVKGVKVTIELLED